MTYNLNFGLAGDEANLLAIRKGAADVVFLQESNEAWQSQLDARLGSEYPERLFHHAPAAGGLAILSKFALRDMGVLEPDKGWFPAWRVVVRGPFGPLQVLSIHLRPAVSDSGSVLSGAYTTPRIRRAEIEDFYGAVDRSLPTLVVGDFNEGASGHAVAFLEDQGLESALAELGGSRYTWHWRTRVGTLELELDHIFYNRMLRPLWAKVIHGGRSDHWPVVAAFERAY